MLGEPWWSPASNCFSSAALLPHNFGSSLIVKATEALLWWRGQMCCAITQGYGIASFQALNVQISEPENWRKALFLQISSIFLQISASEKDPSISGKWPFHEPSILTPTECLQEALYEKLQSKFLIQETWLGGPDFWSSVNNLEKFQRPRRFM